MRRRAAKYLWDADEACGLTIQFVEGRSFDEYEQDALLRSGVERQLSIVGEALSGFRRLEPDEAARITHLRSVVAFRHVLVHDYSDIDDATVWVIATERVRPLRAQLQALLREVDE